jgi:hypothetical protein
VRVTLPSSLGGYGMLPLARESSSDLTFALSGADAGPPPLLTGFFRSSSKARAQQSGSAWYVRETMAPRLRPLITLTFASWHGQPLNLAAGYLFKLRFPTLAWLGDKEQDQTVPRL